MTSLLVIIVLLLVGVAIWQMTKIFDLTQIGANKNSSQIADNKDNNLQGYLMFGFLAFLYIFIIFGLFKWSHLVLVDPASEHGKDYDSLMAITFCVVFFVVAITQALLHYFAFKYRGAEGKKAIYFADNDKLEFIWTIIPVFVLAGLILYGLYTWTNIMFVDEDEDVMYVELYAKQFAWTARYSGKDNVLGKANVRLIEGVNTMGVDMEDPNAQDDISVSELHIPKGKKIVFKLRSQDVLHSAYMPHFRAQMNCVPGMVTQFAFRPIMTTDEMRQTEHMIEKVANINKIRAKKSIELVANGESPLDPYTFDYLLLCNKICGASHYNMQMKIVVDTPEEYQDWLKSQKTIVNAIADDKAAKAAESTPGATTVVIKKVDSAKVAVVATPVAVK
ncbi:cytochrome c oxidase subunit II [Flavobacterium psychrophilum]|uniref:cytochrome c oxidase subunit II n=1 Tax=Flavobacterium psychrophilum TaxID=96345 RepID=UPI0004F793EB|nr:cytochrome c oxidase subunit II [Flavobacterium psychrophilum]AIN73286.1 cytochrome C oxidase subunit II [Flavobacterium psychrophilum FPG3]EKT2069635.1 cytochrome c oxidase subunit II [Flavobacterium psychrophilum]EKT2071895.1 cytochrome c oxidase subunit II [Flavobacterium psychrophilum]EKT4491417.1 cytochrome c oxidase subunit II [Flavobacterium psychrophilum]MBF2043869.1 cytochrome c oxidase subunit II [Flavobacterium psychrophilum]